MGAPLRSRRGVHTIAVPGDNRSVRSRQSLQRIGTPSSNQSLRSRRSDSVNGSSESGEDLPFRVRRACEGVQLVINWRVPPVGAGEVCLLKKWGSWSENVEDGVQLIRDKHPFTIFEYSDQNVSQYEVYYYSLYSKRVSDDVWIITNRYRGKAFPIPTKYFDDQLWKRLPQLYHREDGE